MNPNDIASMLEPLRKPPPVSWWPLAPGWWLLIVLACVLCGVLAHHLWQRYRRGAPLREAQQRLQSLRDDSTLPAAERVAALGQLQRQLAITLSGRDACAGLTGQAWADFLNELGKDRQPLFDADLAQLSYRREVSDKASAQAIEATARWLNTLSTER